MSLFHKVSVEEVSLKHEQLFGEIKSPDGAQLSHVADLTQILIDLGISKKSEIDNRIKYLQEEEGWIIEF